jgi:cytochrome c2
VVPAVGGWGAWKIDRDRAQSASCVGVQFADRPALEAANIARNDKTLDEWIADPEHLAPGNEMTFLGIKDARQRVDLLAFLKKATQPGASVGQGGSAEGMGGMA